VGRGYGTTLPPAWAPSIVSRETGARSPARWAGQAGARREEGKTSRRTNTAPKRIWLTDETREAVQSWADRNGVSFSAALETLARLGLGQSPTEALAPVVVSTVRTEIQHQMHRLASLLAAGALEAGMATRLAGATLKQLRPADYDAIKQAARLDAVQALRRRDALREVADGGDREGQLPQPG
jgi:hypothetical protein